LHDDVISSYLSAAPLVPIWGSASNEQLLQALPDGMLRTPALLPLLFVPRKVDPACVPGMRVAILQERLFGPSAAEIEVDFAVGLNELIPLTDDGHAAFTAAVATSVAECANEAATLPDTAFALLAGVPVTGIQQGDYGAQGSWLKTVPPDKLLRWTELTRLYADYHMVLPKGGAVDAMWVVNRQSGAAKAVLLDSAGGGTFRMDCKNPTDEEAFAFALATAALVCAFIKNLSFWCVGINTAAAVMCVVEIFDGSADIGTPIGVLFGIPSVAKTVSLDVQFQVGIVLILLTMGAMGCFSKGFPVAK
jgi:hypothetical protein